MVIWPLALLALLGLLAMVPVLGIFRVTSSSSSSSSPPSSLSATAPSAEGRASPAGAQAGHQPRREQGSLPVRGGMRRCWTDEEDRSRCLPTVFFFGVSKCGTTSLSNWLAEHPRAVFVPPPEEHDYREAHVFDGSPKFWHNLDARGRREILAPVAAPEDTVIDFTPNYAVVGEAPLRILDFYRKGQPPRNLRFLVVLREPVGRTISSWEYKSELDGERGRGFADGRRFLTPTKPRPPRPPPRTTTNDTTVAERRTWQNSRPSPKNITSAAAAGQERRRMETIAEQRPLWQAFQEGVDRVGKLSDCVRNATGSGLFGREPTVTFCRATKGRKQCNGHPPCELCNTHTEPWCNPRHYLEKPIYHAHVAKSMYAMQLRRWFDVFGRENFKVVFTEDMEADSVKTLAEVLEFLGLDMLDPLGEKGLPSLESWGDIVGARYNTADGAKKKVLDSQVTPELRERMRAFFAPHNKDLQELLGVPLPSSWHVQS